MNKDTPKVFSVFYYEADGYSYRTEERINPKFECYHRLDEEEFIKLMVENNRFKTNDELIILCNGYVVTGNVNYGKVDYTVNESYYEQYLIEYYNLVITNKVLGLIKEKEEKEEKERQELERRKLQQIKEEQEMIRKQLEQNEYQIFLSLKKKYESI